MAYVCKNYIYFYHLGVYYYLPVSPDEITDSMQSTFKETNALSRSAPVFSYVNSGPRTVTVSFTFHRDMLRDLCDPSESNRSARLNSSAFLGGLTGLTRGSLQDFDWQTRSDINASNVSEDYVDALIRNLQAAALPNYENYSDRAKIVNPPMVAMRLSDAVFIKGVISSPVQVNYKKPIMSDGKYSTITISLSISESDPYTADEVATKGSFRGYVRGGIR